MIRVTPIKGGDHSLFCKSFNVRRKKLHAAQMAETILTRFYDYPAEHWEGGKVMPTRLLKKFLADQIWLSLEY